MATGRDPWDWSVDQVIDYFDKFRLSSVEHRPHSALPAALELEKLFRLHDINGSTLLSDVDSTVLREDFQIFSFGQRSAIVYAIRQLRQNSSKYKVRLPLFLAPSAAVTSPPLSHVSLPDRVIGKSLAAQSPSQSLSEAFCSPTRYLTQGDESQNLTFTGPDQPTRVRPGETLIEDQFGRKRRKLTLPPTASSVQGVDVDLKHSGNIVNAAHQKDAPDRASAPNEFDNTLTDSVKNAAIANDTCHEPASCSKRPSGGTFLCRKAIPIDHIFYRDTKFGQSIEDSSTKNAVDALVTDGVEDEFQVVSDGRVSPGDRHFVSNSLKYYFLKAEERQLSIGGMQLLGIYPYPERLVREGSRRSVTVFRPIEGGYEAIRDDAILPGQLPQNDASETSEWDYLSRWQNEDSTVLPYFGESDTEVDFSSGLLQEMEDEEREEEEAKMNKKGPLSLDRVEEIIEGETENLRELWKKRKLPLRESAARSIWFKAGGPRRRAYFVSSTRSKIEKLNVRLVKLKDSILGEVWTKESDVREQCEIMEETVFELQESQHKKSIWEGPTAPAASKKPTKKSKSTRKRESDGEDLVNSDSVMEEDQLADFVVPDDSIADGMQLDDHINVEPDKHTTSPEKDASSTDLKTSDLEPMSEDVDMMDPLSSDGSQTHEIKREPSQALDDETDGAQTQIEASTPKRNSNGADIIELTSSSEQEEEHPIEKMKIEEAEEDERKCETASAEEVSSWRWSELIEQNDRKRLVVKILRTLGPKRYNELRPNVLNPSKEVFTDRFERAMEALRRVNEVLSEPADGNIIAMKRFVRLYVCWVHCLHKYWENSASAELQDRLNEDQVKNLIDYGQYYDFVKSIFTENKTPIIFTLGSPDKDFKNPLNGRKDLICISSGSSGSPGSSEAETDVEMPVRAGKKVVAESKEAKEKRERAHLRKKEQEEREKILRAQLGNMSASTDRIIVNTAKKDEHDFIYLNAHIGSRIKKHQVEGLQFMWREIVSAGQGVARPEMQGCLLAHTMGLGKTMQAYV